MLAYNHERYVAQAVASVLEQRDVQIELLIGDDASTDATGQILGKYASEHPGVVRLLPRPRNLGMYENFADVWRHARGQYFAILEADDYWSHPMKLAAQVSALEANRDWVLSFHRAKVVDGDGRVLGQSPQRPEGPFDWARLARENFVQTCTVVYRAGVVRELPAWLEGLALLDWPLNLLHALEGETGFIDQEWAVYRQHATGTWSPRSRVERLVRSAEMLGRVARCAEASKPTRTDLVRSQSLLLQEAASVLADEGRVKDAKRVFRSSLSAPLDRGRLRSRVGMLVDLYGRPRFRNGP